VPNIVIDCPSTGKPLATGLAMDPQSFASSKLADILTDPCPHCGQMHTWGTQDAYLEGSRPPRPKPGDRPTT
jgi:hypothetical protein